MRGQLWGRNRVIMRLRHQETVQKAVITWRITYRRNKEKDNLFSFIKKYGNIVEFEKYVKTTNPDLNCRDENWLTPLHVATKQNLSTAWITILLRYGADINRLTTDSKTPLHFACENSNNSVAALLLKFKASTSICDKNENTPLSIAKKMNNKELVRLFLSNWRSIAKIKHQKYTKSIDVLRKYSLSRKRSLKNEKSNRNRNNPNYLSNKSKKLLKNK